MWEKREPISCFAKITAAPDVHDTAVSQSERRDLQGERGANAFVARSISYQMYRPALHKL